MTTRLEEIKERLAETERKCGDLLLEADCDLAWAVARIEKLTNALKEAEEYSLMALPHLGDIVGFVHQVQHAENFIRRTDHWIKEALSEVEKE